MTAALDLLLSVAFDRTLQSEHLADLRRSGLTDDTIHRQRIRTVPPDMIGALLGFDPRGVRSAYLIPFPDPRGGFMDHVRMKIFPPLTGRDGHTVKYFQPRGASPRLYFPLATLDAVLRGKAPCWLVEGEKKSVAVAQLGRPAVGFCGVEGWHVAGSRALLPDFDVIPLRGRLVELAPDGDMILNAAVERGARRFADALEARGAIVRFVGVPVEA